MHEFVIPECATQSALAGNGGTRNDGRPSHVTLSDIIARHAVTTPDKAALRFEGKTLSYAAFITRIERTAAALQARYGIAPGDRIAILSQNRPDYLVLLYACAKLGALLVPMNWRLAVAEQTYIITDCAPKLLVLEEAFAAIVPELASQQPAPQLIGFDFTPDAGFGFDALIANAFDMAVATSASLASPLLLVYTSGTTGRPKGAVLTQQAVLTNSEMSRHMHALTPDDHVLTVLPFFHVGGLNIQTTPALHHGATVTIHARFTPDATLASIAQDRPTLTVLVPATIDAVTAHPGWRDADLSSLKAVATGSQIVPPALIARIEARGVPVLQVYGATETGPIAIYIPLDGDRSRIGSTGLAGLRCAAKVIDDDGRELPPETTGEIALRGDNVFIGYWNDRQATTQALVDGWYRSGDIGRRDVDGHFYVQDRKKNMIISGGENIYPAEIERVVLEHPDVVDCGVIGLPDPKWQEAPVAYVIRKPGSHIDADALRAHAAARLARFKLPRDIVFVDDLPRTALGKVQHFRLRLMVMASAQGGER